MPASEPFTLQETLKSSLPLACFVCAEGKRSPAFASVDLLRRHLEATHTVCGDRRGCGLFGTLCIKADELERVVRVLALIVKVRIAQKKFGVRLYSRTADFTPGTEEQSPAHADPFACFLCVLSPQDNFLANTADELREHLYSEHCRMSSCSGGQFACPKCEDLFPSQLRLRLHFFNCSRPMHGGPLSMAWAYLGHIEAAERDQYPTLAETKQGTETIATKDPLTTGSLSLQDHLRNSEILKRHEQANAVAYDESAKVQTPSAGPKPESTTGNYDHLPDEIKASPDKLQDWQDQLMLLEQQNRKRLMMQRQKQKMSEKEVHLGPETATASIA